MITSTPTNATRTPQPKPEERSPLQKHVDFFDRNGDHETTVCETFQGLRALGLGRIASGGAAFVINLGLGLKTGAHWYSPLTVQNDNIAAGKHDSDSDTYDEKGNFVQAKFDEMFATFDTNKDNQFNKAEIDHMLDTRKETFVGRQAAGAEFGLLLKLAGQESAEGEKVLTKERLASLYDGSLFYTVEAEVAAARG